MSKNNSYNNEFYEAARITNNKRIQEMKIVSFLGKYKKNISLTVSGNSMQPFLVPGNKVTFESRPEYEVGDVVLFIHQNWMLVHRIINISTDSSGQKYQIKGDNCTTADGSFCKDDILGKLVSVREHGGEVTFNNEFQMHKARISALEAVCKSILLRRFVTLARKAIFYLMRD